MSFGGGEPRHLKYSGNDNFEGDHFVFPTKFIEGGGHLPLTLLWYLLATSDPRESRWIRHVTTVCAIRVLMASGGLRGLCLGLWGDLCMRPSFILCPIVCVLAGARNRQQLTGMWRFFGGDRKVVDSDMRRSSLVFSPALSVG